MIVGYIFLMVFGLLVFVLYIEVIIGVDGLLFLLVLILLDELIIIKGNFFLFFFLLLFLFCFCYNLFD